MLKAKKEELQERGVKGFTLMEMLIVVAIIAVLIAIAIPTFTSQLEKSREAADAANVRSAYANAMVKMLNSANASGSDSIVFQQGQDGWQNSEIGNNLSALAESSYVTIDGSGPTAGGTTTLSWSGGKLTITIG